MTLLQSQYPSMHSKCSFRNFLEVVHISFIRMFEIKKTFQTIIDSKRVVLTRNKFVKYCSIQTL